MQSKRCPQWMDEKIPDEEKLEMAEPTQTKWKWENGVGELRQ